MTTQAATIEILNWDELVRYTQFLCSNENKNYKICLIDEEQEEIRIENKNEFEMNVKYAKDHALKSLTFVVYVDNQRSFNGIYHLEKPTANFPLIELEQLRKNVLPNKWYIPVKIDEAFGICLNAAIKFAQDGKLDSNAECKEFIEKILPEAFRKLITTQSTFTWPREIHCRIFDLAELLVDLVGIRLQSSPVPVALLNTLAIIFDTNTTFAQKHKDEQIPSDRIYQIDDEDFLNVPSADSKGSFGWIRSLIQRFIARNGLKNLRNQFESISKSTGTIKEYHCLVELFSKCYQCINARRFRLLFTRSIKQTIRFYLEQKSNTKLIDNQQLEQFNECLIDLCFQFEMNDEVNEILQITTKNPFEQLTTNLETLTVNNNNEKVKTKQLIKENKRKQKQKQKHHQDNTMKNYDRSNPDEIGRYFAPMKAKIAGLYDNLQTATGQGDLHRVLKIQEKLKLLRPYSARFIADHTIPDGTIMQPAEIFRKTWILLNDGSLSWDNDDIQLMNLFDGIEIIGQTIIPVTGPHQRAMITVEYRCAEQTGDYESKWILAYRGQTFGPMFWCSIKVESKTNKTAFELVDDSLPACFDLTKPYQTSMNSMSNSIYKHYDSLQNSSITIEDNSTELIDLTSSDSETRTSIQSNHSLVSLDATTTNHFNTTEQADSTDKNTDDALQPNQTDRPVVNQNNEIVDEFFEHIENEEPSNQPMDLLFEMGFTNRTQNQRLLDTCHNDLNRVVEILTTHEI